MGSGQKEVPLVTTDSKTYLLFLHGLMVTFILFPFLVHIHSDKQWPPAQSLQPGTYLKCQIFTFQFLVRQSQTFPIKVHLFPHLKPHSSCPFSVPSGSNSIPLRSVSLPQRLASNFQKFHCGGFEMKFSGLFCWGSLSLLNMSYVFYQILEDFRYHCFRDVFLATLEFLLLSHGILRPSSFLSFLFSRQSIFYLSFSRWLFWLSMCGYCIFVLESTQGTP